MANNYMDSVKKYKLFSLEEEKKYCLKYFETKDIKLRNLIAIHNLRLVVKIAHEYRASYSNISDLIQEGNIGLLRGIEKYDPTRGVPLANYAANWCRAFMLRHIINNSRLVKLGTTETQRKLFFNLSKEKAKLEAQGIAVDDAVLAKNLNVEEKELSEMNIRLSSPESSIETKGVGDLKSNDFTPDEALVQAEIHNKLLEFRNKLSYTNKIIFNRRFLQNKQDTFEEIGLDLGVTRQRVQQIDAQIKSKLQIFFKNAGKL